MRVRCGCHPPESLAAEYQDKKYGKGFRIANSTAKLNVFRCTVCGKESGDSFSKRR